MGSATGATAEILLLEDSAGDVALFREALAQTGAEHRLHVVGDTEQGLAFLRCDPPYERAPRPDVVFIDIGVPGRSGMECFAEIRRDPKLADLPVVVLTGSVDEDATLESYALRAEGHLLKPPQPTELEYVLKRAAMSRKYGRL